MKTLRTNKAISKNLGRKTEGGDLEKENDSTLFPVSKTMCTGIKSLVLSER